MRRLLFLAVLPLTFTAFGQKKSIDPSVYNDWNRIGDILVSPDGTYSVYTIRPLRGDGYLYIVNNETGKKDSIARGLEPQFSGSGSYLAFKINPGFDTLRSVELKKINKDKWPKDTLGIWIFANDSLIKFPKIKDFKLSAESDWMAFLSTTNEWPKDYLTKKQKKKEAKLEKKKGVKKTDGKLLTIWHPDREEKVVYRYVTQYDISRNGEYVAFLEQEKFKKDSVRFVISRVNNTTVSVSRRKSAPVRVEWKHPQRFNEVSQMSFSYTSNRVTGLYTTDTTEQKRWNLFTFDGVNSTWETIIDTTMRFETGRMLSSNYRPRMLENDQTLFFGVWDAPERPVKDTLLESEKVKLDLWHWKDARMQPQQLVELKRDQTRFNLYAYHFADKRTVQIGRDSLRVRTTGEKHEPYVMATCDEKYEGETWRSPLPANYYRISTTTGEILPLRIESYFGTLLSPSGKYLAYYNIADKQQYVMVVDEKQDYCATCNTKANWYQDINGMPTEAGPLGAIGWTAGEQGLLLRSESDIWLFDLPTHNLTSITASLRKNAADTNYRYDLTNLRPDSTLLYAENLLLTQFDKQTKAMKVYSLTGSFPQPTFNLIEGSNHNYFGFKKAKKGNTLLFQRQSVAEYPDLYAVRNASVAKKISETNPQQKDYNWATVELIDWKSYDGIPLSGLLYKPENYDPAKSYPLLIYYYELYSDDLHTHYAPKPTASIIHPTEYASAGYLVFIPDIRYKVGHPAQSAYDCIMSGTDAVLKKYPNIDPKRMGLQGQSWGGYQTAQLITMTNRFAAAMAGAPVGNMFSAYGGIRWGSGYSRQFQYEHTQSRIGKTIWEAQDLYVENSPIFHLPKVATPLLIMHNDQDGAVPWYQGIELYAGLRRLGKPVWLLNYNGDDHNLLKNPNRMDLSIRMRQFFDYYLLGEPMPLWLKEGIPAIEKGKEYRLELIDE